MLQTVSAYCKFVIPLKPHGKKCISCKSITCSVELSQAKFNFWTLTLGGNGSMLTFPPCPIDVCLGFCTREALGVSNKIICILPLSPAPRLSPSPGLFPNREWLRLRRQSRWHSAAQCVWQHRPDADTPASCSEQTPQEHRHKFPCTSPYPVPEISDVICISSA